MGSRSAQAYLASPEVVAASALSGKISGTGVYQAPAEWSVDHGWGTGVERNTEHELSHSLQQMESLVERVESAVDASESTMEIIPGFPERISGEILLCDADNLDTDNIYAGKFVYKDDLSKEDMARVCMQNYDPEFNSVAKPNDILVSGWNFGCGSSKEQAATALLAKQIPLVIAGSFGNILARNSINNALMCLEIPRLVERLRTRFSPLPSSSVSLSEPAVHEPTTNEGSLDAPADPPDGLDADMGRAAQRYRSAGGRGGRKLDGASQQATSEHTGDYCRRWPRDILQATAVKMSQSQAQSSISIPDAQPDPFRELFRPDPLLDSLDSLPLPDPPPLPDSQREIPDSQESSESKI
jgi:3-isopropylmalate dehydratase small subunit